MYRYDYEIIDGREVLTGGQAGPGMPVPLPGPEMIDEYGRYRYVKGKDGAPELKPVTPTAEDLAVEEKAEKIKQVTSDLATAIVEGGITVADIIAKVKEPKTLKEKA